MLRASHCGLVGCHYQRIEDITVASWITRRGTRRLSHAKRGGVVLAGVLLLASAAGCNSSKASGGSEKGDFDSAAAQANVEKATALPTALNITTPLKAAPETGKTVVFLNCDFEQCETTSDWLTKAAAVVGWNVKKIPYISADPATLIAAFKEALQYDPAAVALNGINRSVWESIVPVYREAGVPIVAGLGGPQKVDDVLVANLWNEDDLAANAADLANWVAVDSDGSGEVAVFGVPDFPILGGFPGAFTESLSDVCPGCKVTEVKATIAQATNPGTTTGLLISAVQRDPAIKYIISSDGVFHPGLPAALAGAGLTDIKIGAALPGLENFTQVAAGKEQAMSGSSFEYYGYLMMDSILRNDQRMTIESGDGGMPKQLITKDNVGTPTTDIKGPEDIEGKFAELWQVAG
jgi:ribose transport system substrate-binding protein